MSLMTNTLDLIDTMFKSLGQFSSYVLCGRLDLSQGYDGRIIMNAQVTWIGTMDSDNPWTVAGSTVMNGTLFEVSRVICDSWPLPKRCLS